MLAAGISNAHDFNEVWEISLGLRGCMKSILKLVKEESLVSRKVTGRFRKQRVRIRSWKRVSIRSEE